MRILSIGTQKHTRVVVKDTSEYNACHKYSIEDRYGNSFADVQFQKGAILDVKEVNGCHNEDLLAIVIDRLQGFQASEFKCRENALALNRIEEAMHWLRHRTDERNKRGVEGTNKL